MCRETRPTAIDSGLRVVTLNLGGKMISLSRIKKKLTQSGFRGLLASAMRRELSHIEYSHQSSAHKVLSRYISFEGKDVLEFGGAQFCDSTDPFFMDGVASVTVTGLDHISQEYTDSP